MSTPRFINRKLMLLSVGSCVLSVIHYLFARTTVSIGVVNTVQFFTSLLWFYSGFLLISEFSAWSKREILGWSSIFMLPSIISLAVFSLLVRLSYGEIITGLVGLSLWIIYVYYLFAICKKVITVKKFQLVVPALITLASLLVTSTPSMLPLALYFMSFYVNQLFLGIISTQALCYFGIHLLLFFILLQKFAPIKRNRLIGLCLVLLIYTPHLFFSTWLDVSDNRRFTFSSQTQKIIRNMSSPVRMTFVVSSDIPPQVRDEKEYILQTLSLYKSLSKGKITYQLLDPRANNKNKEKASAWGVPEIRFNEKKKGSDNIYISYFGLVIQGNNQTYVIPQALSTRTLEYEIAAALYRQQWKSRPIVTLIDVPTTSPKDIFEPFKRAVAAQFGTKDVSVALSQDKKMYDKNSVSIFYVDPSLSYESTFSAQLKQYVEKGNTLIVLADGIKVAPTKEKGLVISDASHNLFPLFAQYGLLLQKNLVLSGSSETVGFEDKNGTFYAQYPFALRTNKFAENSPYSALQEIVMPWTSSVTFTKKAGIQQKLLVVSTKNSWSQTGRFSLVPDDVLYPKKDAMKQYPLVVEATTKNGGKLILIPSTHFVQDPFVSGAAGNYPFIQRLLNNAFSKGELETIEAKNLTQPILKPTTTSQKDAMMAIFSLLPVLVTIGYEYLFKKRILKA